LEIQYPSCHCAFCWAITEATHQTPESKASDDATDSGR
jgi:hypothetical protein